jgi:predicted unusual protein kinase regulating ubiquinone biosynthesis (AarF/ABC1/UbiB family)
VVNVDTHPGNYLFHEDGRVTFIDFGCVSRFSSSQLEKMQAVLRAMIAGDDDAILDSLLGMGLLRSGKGFDTEVLFEPIRRSFQPIQSPQPFKYTRELVAEVIAESLKLRVGADELRVIQRLDCPPEYVLIGRVSVGLESVLAYLEATVDYRRVFDDVFGDDDDPALSR